MVYQDSIPFCAPSQLRLRGVVDTDGLASFTVLDAYNQPIGNLHDMKVAVADLQAVADLSSERANAAGEQSTCAFHMGSDNAHQMLAVDYEDPGAFLKRSAAVRLEDFRELVSTMQAPVA